MILEQPIGPVVHEVIAMSFWFLVHLTCAAIKTSISSTLFKLLVV